jgi:hypothetical protein
LADGYVIQHFHATHTKFYSLLAAPFDFSQAFDQALKRIVVALPNRPAKEADDDAVGSSILLKID